MRKLTDHKVDGVEDGIDILVLDGPGPGGANHEYCITTGTKRWDLRFQKGAIKEVGLNGITNESLLVILLDRLKGFQEGKFACEDNEEQIVLLTAALDAAKRRTIQRRNRGIEGTMTV